MTTLRWWLTLHLPLTRRQRRARDVFRMLDALP
jgi:hypothetical protein